MNVVHYVVSNRETFIESWQAIDTETGEAIDLTGATIVFEIAPKNGGSTELTATTDNGKAVITTTAFTVRFEVSELRDIEPQQYNMGCTIVIDDDTTQLFVGTLDIIDGVVS